MAKRILEAVWDCSVCPEREIPGSQWTCVCGNIHNSVLKPSEAFYLPKGKRRVVTDPEQLKLAKSGKSWNCGYDGVKMRGTDTHCYECGRPRSGDDMVTPTATYVQGEAAEGVELDTEGDIENDRVDSALNGWGDRLYAGVEDKPFENPERILPNSALPHEAPSQYTPYPETGTSSVQDGQSGEPDEESADEPKALNGGRIIALLNLLEPFKRPLLIGLAGVVGLALVFLGGKWIYDEFIHTEPVTVTVTAKSWQRQIAIEEIRTFREEDWDIPYGGRYVSQREKFHHNDQVHDYWREWDETVYDDVPDGEEEYVCGTTTKDLGNGHFEEEDKYCTRTKYKKVERKVHHREEVMKDVPVYRTWYTYDIDRWIVDHYDTASSDQSATPYWPQPTVRSTKQREGSRTESYSVVLSDPLSRTSHHNLAQPVWDRLTVGMTLQAQMPRRGPVRDIAWPQG